LEIILKSHKGNEKKYDKRKHAQGPQRISKISAHYIAWRSRNHKGRGVGVWAYPTSPPSPEAPGGYVGQVGVSALKSSRNSSNSQGSSTDYADFV
jgi:hypothetical protein